MRIMDDALHYSLDAMDDVHVVATNETSPSSLPSTNQSGGSLEALLLPFRIHSYSQYSTTNSEEASVMLHYSFYGVLLAMSSVIVLTSQYEAHRGSDLLRR